MAVLHSSCKKENQQNFKVIFAQNKEESVFSLVLKITLGGTARMESVLCAGVGVYQPPHD